MYGLARVLTATQDFGRARVGGLDRPALDLSPDRRLDGHGRDLLTEHAFGRSGGQNFCRQTPLLPVQRNRKCQNLGKESRIQFEVNQVGISTRLRGADALSAFSFC